MSKVGEGANYDKKIVYNLSQYFYIYPREKEVSQQTERYI